MAARDASPPRTGATTLTDLRRCYRNWLAVAVALKVGRSVPNRVVLRDGTVLGPPATRGRLFALADAVRRGWDVRGGPERSVTVRPSPGIDLECRWDRGFDLENAIEVFGDEVYRVPVRGRWVIDGGAGTGDSALYFAREGAAEIVAFEPLPESQALFRRTVARSPFADRIRLLPEALGGATGTRSLRFPTEVPGAASLAPADDAKARWNFGASVDVPVRTLADAVPPATSGRGVLKLDCQGAEYEILDGATDSLLDRFESIVVEFTNGPGTLPVRLRAAGFDVVADPVRRGYLRATRPA